MKRRIIRNKYRKHKSDIDMENYKLHHNYCKKLPKKTKLNYFSNLALRNCGYRR